MIRFKLSFYWFYVILLLLGQACQQKPSDEESRNQQPKIQKETVSQGEKYLIEKLVHAAGLGDKNSVIYFLDGGADINGFNNKDKTALMKSALNRHTDVVRLLIERGADIKVKNKIDLDAMSSAIISDSQEIVRLLLKSGYDVSLVNSKTRDLVYLSASKETPEILKLLLNEGLQVKKAYPKDYDGETALHQAAMYCKLETMKILIHEGSPIDIQEKSQGYTPLMRAAWENCTEAVILLVDLGAEVNKTNNLGRSVLGSAARNGNPLSVEYLIKHGADTNYKDTDNQTPLDLAIEQAPLFKSKKSEYDKTIKLLKEQMKE